MTAFLSTESWNFFPIQPRKNAQKWNNRNGSNYRKRFRIQFSGCHTKEIRSQKFSEFYGIYILLLSLQEETCHEYPKERLNNNFTTSINLYEGRTAYLHILRGISYLIKKKPSCCYLTLPNSLGVTIRKRSGSVV
jgi:hypothetical protein